MCVGSSRLHAIGCRHFGVAGIILPRLLRFHPALRVISVFHRISARTVGLLPQAGRIKFFKWVAHASLLVVVFLS